VIIAEVEGDVKRRRRRRRGCKEIFYDTFADLTIFALF
jgi:hypothetical protein